MPQPAMCSTHPRLPGAPWCSWALGAAAWAAPLPPKGARVGDRGVLGVSGQLVRGALHRRARPCVARRLRSSRPPGGNPLPCVCGRCGSPQPGSGVTVQWGRLSPRRPKQVHICTGFVRKINRTIWLVNPTKYPLFCQRFVEAGMGLQKVSFSPRLYKRSAFHTSPSGIWRPRNTKIIFEGKWSYLPTFWITRLRTTLNWNV